MFPFQASKRRNLRPIILAQVCKWKNFQCERVSRDNLFHFVSSRYFDRNLFIPSEYLQQIASITPKNATEFSLAQLQKCKHRNIRLQIPVWPQSSHSSSRTFLHFSRSTQTHKVPVNAQVVEQFVRATVLSTFSDEIYYRLRVEAMPIGYLGRRTKLQPHVNYMLAAHVGVKE